MLGDKSRVPRGDTAEGDAYYVSVPDPSKLLPRMPFLAEGRSSKLSRHVQWNIQRPGHLVAVFLTACIQRRATATQ